ncbi:MAG: adenosine kinase [Phenylobacterium sp.]
MSELYDVTAIGNAIVDVIAPAEEGFVERHGYAKGAMNLVDEAQATALYGAMAPGIETSGGSAGNTVAGLASFGGKAAFLGKVADDQLGAVFAHDMRAIGAAFDGAPLQGGPATARCLINVTPDGQRTMCTFLGASVRFTSDDIDAALIRASRIVYLEGYLFDAPAARQAFEQAAAIARGAGRMIALTLSDAFVVDRWRDDLLAFIDRDVDLLFANEDEAKSLFQTEDFDAAAARLRGRVKIAALTRSEQGSVVLTDRDTLTVSAAPVEKVVDTTGAGDQYAAGFLFGLSEGRPLDACARLGSLAAAEVISHYGPRPQISLRELAARQGN